MPSKKSRRKKRERARMVQIPLDDPTEDYEVIEPYPPETMQDVGVQTDEQAPTAQEIATLAPTSCIIC